MILIIIYFSLIASLPIILIWAVWSCDKEMNLYYDELKKQRGDK